MTNYISIYIYSIIWLDRKIDEGKEKGKFNFGDSRFSGTFARDQKLVGGNVFGNHNFTNGPTFEMNVPRNVTTAVGQTAFLHCRVHQLGDKEVRGFTCYFRSGVPFIQEEEGNNEEKWSRSLLLFNFSDAIRFKRWQ